MNLSLDCDFQRVIEALCIDTDTPRSLAIFLMVRNREWDQLVNLKVDPVSYVNTSIKNHLAVLGWVDVGTRRTTFQLKLDLAVTELLRKNADLPTSYDVKKAAKDSFFLAENLCCSTNLRFSRLINNFGLTECEARLLPFLEGVKKRVAKILGPIPNVLDFGFGKGSTYSDRGSAITVGHKMENDGSRTSSTTAYLPLWGETAWARARSGGDCGPYEPRVVPGNRFFSVPKTAVTERGACAEPSLNIFLQKGLGTYVRRRLEVFGIDLEHGQSLHSKLACEASIHGRLATVDLSMASDTVSRNVVKYLLPEDWYAIFDDFRSKKTEIDGKWFFLEKFSSMGNGFTFELETLIFYCIALTSNDRKVVPGGYSDIKVYGDDIIVPTASTKILLNALAFFGFKPNLAKTFVSGVFRESCGGDFFCGHNVRGFNLEKLPTEPHQWISFANSVRRMGERHFNCAFSRTPFQRGWRRILDAIPSDIRRNRGPRLLGDLVIEDDESRWVTRWGENPKSLNPGNGQTLLIRVWMPVREVYPFNRFRSEIQLAMALLGVSSTGAGVRRNGDELCSYHVRWIPAYGLPDGKLF